MISRLYCHIPFCIRKCSYCSFFSGPASRDVIDSYVKLLCREVALMSDAESCGQLDSIYIGGGTPSVLTERQVASILAAVSRRFTVATDAEITMEVNPGTVSLQSLSAFRACGINRLSVGVQSFDDNYLTLLGRLHTAAQAIDVVDAARGAGFDNLGIDLMHALPGQVLHDWRNDLRQAVALQPEHLSIYGLTIEPDTPFAVQYASGADELPDDELSAQMFELADEYLAANGFEHYEIANYARPGRRSRHNSGYWQRDGYCGIGAGAHSFVRQGYGVRFSNVADLAQYQQLLDQGVLPRHDQSTLTKNDALSEFMFLGLRMADGIRFQAVFDQFGVVLQEQFVLQIQQLAAAGLLVESPEGIRLTRRGMLLSNQVFSRFFVD